VALVQRLLSNWIGRGREDQRLSDLRRALSAEAQLEAVRLELKVKELEKLSTGLLMHVLRDSPYLSIDQGTARIVVGADLAESELSTKLAEDIRARAAQWAASSSADKTPPAPSKRQVRPEPPAARVVEISPDDIVYPTYAREPEVAPSRSLELIAEFHRRIEEKEREGHRG
jgi:hypothetical protein